MNNLPNALRKAVYAYVSLRERAQIMCCSQEWAVVCRETPLSVLKLRGTSVAPVVGRLAAKSVSWTADLYCGVDRVDGATRLPGRDEIYYHTAEWHQAEKSFRSMYKMCLDPDTNGTQALQRVRQMRELWLNVRCDLDVPRRLALIAGVRELTLNFGDDRGVRELPDLTPLTGLTALTSLTYTNARTAVREVDADGAPRLRAYGRGLCAVVTARANQLRAPGFRACRRF